MEDTSTAIAIIRDQAREVAAGWSVPGAPASWRLTATIFTGLAEDDDLLTLAAAIPLDRLPPLLLSGAARYLIDKYDPDPLASYFPVAGRPQPPLDDGLWPAFKAFCMRHRGELAEVCGRHRYQMNEVARCTQIAVALGMLTRDDPSRPVALVDIGTGSGLGLHLDRYRYTLGDQASFGDPASTLDLRCEIRGALDPPVPQRLPPITHRMGVDTSPIDLSDPAAVRWLVCCTPPEAASVTRCAGAIAIARAHRSPVVAGDACDVLPELLRSMPSWPRLVLTDAYTAVFFSEEQLARLNEIVAGTGASRDIAWISLDPLIPLGSRGRSSVQGLDLPGPLISRYQREGVFSILGVVSYEDGRRRQRLLARSHPSGTWMEWLDPETA
jgi:hypothetical protein